MRFAHWGKYQLLDFGFQPLQIPVSLGFVLNPLQSKSYEWHIRTMAVQPRFESERLKNVIVASAATIIFKVLIFDFVINLCTDFFCRIVFCFCSGIRKKTGCSLLSSQREDNLGRMNSGNTHSAATFRLHFQVAS